MPAPFVYPAAAPLAGDDVAVGSLAVDAGRGLPLLAESKEVLGEEVVLAAGLIVLDRGGERSGPGTDGGWRLVLRRSFVCDGIAGVAKASRRLRIWGGNLRRGA